MRYYDCGGYPLCSREVLALPALHALPETGEVLFGFHRTPGIGRDTFPVTAPSLLTAEEGVSTLVTAEEPETDPALAAAIAAGRVRAVNLAHPRQEELLPPLRRRERVRVNLLALGDVGSTLLMGLRLLGGDVIDSIGICDVRENVPQRWEMELNQIVSPEGERLPPVEIVSPEEVFDGDVFLFCASRFVPDTSVTSGDVRMAQYQVNRELAVRYARMARQRRYGGMFCVVSDPVDPLCRAVLEESNRDETGRWDGGGLFSHQTVPHTASYHPTAFSVRFYFLHKPKGILRNGNFFHLTLLFHLSFAAPTNTRSGHGRKRNKPERFCGAAAAALFPPLAPKRNGIFCPPLPCFHNLGINKPPSPVLCRHRNGKIPNSLCRSLK